MSKSYYPRVRAPQRDSDLSRASGPTMNNRESLASTPPLNTSAHARFGPSFTNSVSPLILQAKMTVGPVGDAYEQEADTVAQEVVQQMQSPTVQREPGVDASLQRAGEEDELQMKPLSTSISSIQRAGEEEELQAKKDSSLVQRAGEEDELQMKPLSESLQRAGEEDELQMKGEGIGTSGGAVDASLESTIQSAKGSGTPLSDTVRKPMEQAFGADFSKVRVHNDATSDSLNRSIQAKAFTTGSDVFFRSGEYQPTTTSGQELLAHELTHTIQQGAA